MVQTFLFDMGNVLVGFSHERMCTQMGALCDRTGDAVRELLIESGLQWEFERGQITPEQFHRRFEDAAGSSVDFDALVHAGSNIFFEIPGVHDVLNQLKSRGHRLVLLSNTSIAHFEFIRREFPVLDPFDDYVLSYEVGSLKPDPPMYEAALDQIACAPSECFYTDDIPHNVEAGRQFGLDAEVFTTVESLIDQLQTRGIPLAPRMASHESDE